MQPQESFSLFASYAADCRERPIRGFRREAFSHLVRYTALVDGAEGFVAFAHLPQGQESRWIREQVEYFRGIGQKFEWKVYDFDQPRNLKALLEAEGFEPGEKEAFMVMPISDQQITDVHPHRPGKVDIRPITKAEQLDDVVSVQAQVWKHDFSWLGEMLADLLQNTPDEISIYGAYRKDTPVGCGWIQFPQGSRFADLHGGSVIEAERGQGIYSELFAVRADKARRRGYDFLAVDAAPMSRPILEKKGFIHVCHTVPMRLSER